MNGKPRTEFSFSVQRAFPRVKSMFQPVSITQFPHELKIRMTMKTLLLTVAIAGFAVAAQAAPSLTANFSIYDNHGGNADGTPFIGPPVITGTRSFFDSTLHLGYQGVSLSPLGESDLFYFPLGGSTPYGAQMTGLFLVPSAGSYSFGTYSDDGSILYVDGNLVVDNGGAHSPTAVFNSATLTAGPHSFLVNFFEDFGGEAHLTAYFDPSLVAVPEPSTTALTISFACAGLLIVLWKRRLIAVDRRPIERR